MTWRARAGCPAGRGAGHGDGSGRTAGVRRGLGQRAHHGTYLLAGWDGAARPGDPSGILTWTRTVTDERDVVLTLASLGQHDNVELVGAWLLTGPPQGGAAG